MTENRASIGVAGLDEVLEGGLLPRRTYLLRGGPGMGKTTLGLHFLTTGAAAGETALFITLGEPEAQLRENAERLGFDLTGIHFLDLSPSPEFFAEVETYDLFSPAEVEREPTTRKIVGAVEELKPQRVFLDAMTQFRYLTTDEFQFRKQALSFVRFLAEQGATVLFTSESSAEAPDDDLQFLSDGVLTLGMGTRGRTVRVSKFRGSGFRSGEHSMRLTDRGMEVFPKLVPAVYTREYVAEAIPSGVPELDELLHGGLERGTVTVITGPSGVGKTTLGLLFMKEAAGRGEHSALYTFEEAAETLLARSEALNLPVRAMVEHGTLNVNAVEPLQYSHDEFARLVRRDVEENETRVVMLDSLSGYRVALEGEDLVSHIHALARYLANMGVTTLLTNELESVTGDFRPTEQGISYVADNIVFLRYLEFRGELRKAIGVLKKRQSGFENTLRELAITRYGVKVGRPLEDLRGILSGAPEWTTPAET